MNDVCWIAVDTTKGDSTPHIYGVGLDKITAIADAYAHANHLGIRTFDAYEIDVPLRVVQVTLNDKGRGNLTLSDIKSQEINFP